MPDQDSMQMLNISVLIAVDFEYSFACIFMKHEKNRMTVRVNNLVKIERNACLLKQDSRGDL